MAVTGKNRHDHWLEIRTRHWLETAKRCGFSDMKTVIEEAIERTPQIADSILSGIVAAAERLAQEQ